MIKNPILPGFNGDPCICKKGDDFYMATSSLEWFPGIPVYHSKDLKNWELYTNCLDDEKKYNLHRLEPSKGIWAPCLTYCEQEEMFYIVYGIMHSMNADFFDIENYVIKAKDLKGEWSEPVYVGSAGFDASIFHDDDGRKYIVSLEWETRVGYEQPGAICLAEYDIENKCLKELPIRVWTGGTDRGCIEGPHIYKRNGYYYMLCAEGGTGYGHCVTIARSKNIWGPYENNPDNPILTSAKCDFNERHDSDFLKPHYYNKDLVIQKSGHASLIETKLGEAYLVHLMGRPFLPELRCTLGRETSIQEMEWTDDGWLRLKGGGNFAKEYVNESRLPETKFDKLPDKDDFDNGFRNDWYTPRIDYRNFAEISNGKLEIKGQESLCSLNNVSLLAKKLTSVQTKASTKLEFEPEVYQHSAGITIFYDNMNYVFFRKYYSQELDSPALGILVLENGVKSEWKEHRVKTKGKDVWMQIQVEGRHTKFGYSFNGDEYKYIDKEIDTSVFSDEYSNYGEFTGAFMGIACVDSMMHSKKAYFTYFEKISDDLADVK